MPDGPDLVRYSLGDGTVVLFEVDEASGYRPASAADVVAQVRDAVAPALAAAQVVVERARAAAPDEVEVTFGIKVSGTANWWIAKLATEGSFQVKLTWSPGSGTINPVPGPAEDPAAVSSHNRHEQRDT